MSMKATTMLRLKIFIVQTLSQFIHLFLSPKEGITNAPIRYNTQTSPFILVHSFCSTDSYVTLFSSHIHFLCFFLFPFLFLSYPPHPQLPLLRNRGRSIEELRNYLDNCAKSDWSLQQRSYRPILGVVAQ